MKKNILFASALTLSMMLSSVAAPVMAANVVVPTQEKDPNGVLTGHTYKAYQIFAGVYTKPTEAGAKGTLKITGWGKDVNGPALLGALKADNAFTGKDNKNLFSGITGDEKDAAERVAYVVSKFEDNSDLAKHFAQVVIKHKTNEESGTVLSEQGTDLSDGYYLVEDTTTTEDQENKAKNLSFLQVVGDKTIEIKVKTDIPEIAKKVDENNDTIPGADDSKPNTKDPNSNVNDYLSTANQTKKLNDIADYDMNTDIPFEFISKVPDYSQYKSYVYKIHDEYSKGLDIKPETIVVKIGNRTLVKDTDYTVIHDKTNRKFSIEIADLTVTEINSDGKTVQKYPVNDQIIVTYNGNLNNEAEVAPSVNTNKVQLEYSNNPNDEHSGETGKTPWDTVGVFTYKLNVNKISKDDGSKLEGAQFKLWNAEEDGKVAVFENGKFQEWSADATKGTVLTTNAAGQIMVQGLDSGTYYLEETLAPTGYVKLEDRVKLELKVINVEDGFHVQNWDGETSTFAGLTTTTVDATGEDHTVGAAEGDKPAAEEGNVTVENGHTANLPETGGMGTTMLYTVGALLAGGAAVFYVVNRRTKNEE